MTLLRRLQSAERVASDLWKRRPPTNADRAARLRELLESADAYVAAGQSHAARQIVQRAQRARQLLNAARERRLCAMSD